MSSPPLRHRPCCRWHNRQAAQAEHFERGLSRPSTTVTIESRGAGARAHHRARIICRALIDLSLPVAAGGTWRDRQSSVRPIADALRVLAAADPSPALVSAMHPAVLSFWLANEAPGDVAWEVQRAAVFATAAGGAQWGTLTSEPGSGGDIMRTRSTAAPVDELDDLVSWPPISGLRRQAFRQWHWHLLIHVHHGHSRWRVRTCGLLPRYPRPRGGPCLRRLHRYETVGRGRHVGDPESCRSTRPLWRDPARLAVAELAEQIMVRIGRVVGGATYSESSPFASWFEDVRTLGFLRPPWGLMFDNLWHQPDHLADISATTCDTSHYPKLRRSPFSNIALAFDVFKQYLEYRSRCPRVGG